MIISLILLSIALTVAIGAMCRVLYMKQNETLCKMQHQQEMLANLDTGLRGLADQQIRIIKRIDLLATNVVQREKHPNPDDRHQLAIQSARQGKGVSELTQLHGMSADEAALIMSLHSPQTKLVESEVKNANLFDPTEVDLA